MTHEQAYKAISWIGGEISKVIEDMECSDTVTITITIKANEITIK